MTSLAENNDMEMFAAQYGEFGGEIEVQKVCRPECPDDGVVVKVMATGVCKSDWHGWMGHDGDIATWFERNKGKRFTPGHEVAGE